MQENNIEKAYKEYIEACFGNMVIPKGQDIELRKAFFAGVGWLNGVTTGSLLDDENKAMNFLEGIRDEFDSFLEVVKTEIN